jgi:hypothetical protein
MSPEAQRRRCRHRDPPFGTTQSGPGAGHVRSKVELIAFVQRIDHPGNGIADTRSPSVGRPDIDRHT